jgi:MFS family permease
MARKRRRSRNAGAGAAGCGPFGLLLALAAIGLLIQYWWVLLIVLGVVALTVAGVRFAMTRTLPARARSPKSARPPKPRPVMAPPRPALVSEDLAVLLRAAKQVRHIRDMQEWDYEWIRLTYPEKSSREHSEIANAHFARGRSIGVNCGDVSVPRLRGPKPQ